MFERYEQFTKQLGIRHPVLLAPMDLVAGGRLAAAVTNAGGIGRVTPAGSTVSASTMGAARRAMSMPVSSFVSYPGTMDS